MRHFSISNGPVYDFVRKLRICMPAFSACESQQIINSRRDESYTIRFQVQVDGGDWTPMAEGYPKFDGTDKFTFRFPKFTKSLLYDPTFTPGTAPAAASNTKKTVITRSWSGAKTTASVCLASFFLALLVAIFQ